MFLQGREEEAIKSLKWLRGQNYNLDSELADIKMNIERSRNEKLSWASFRTPAAKKSLAIGFWLMFFQQFIGPNAVVFNTTKIFKV